MSWLPRPNPVSLRIPGRYHRFMRSVAPVLAPTFRSRTQGDLLARVLLHPDREWTISDLARELDVPLTTVQTEVARLIGGGILVDRKVGRARVVRANPASPAVGPLTQLTLVTFGPQTVIADEFDDLDAQQVIVFGSWAARYHGQPGPLPADIDVLVIGDQVDREQVYAAAERAESRLGIPVNPVLRSTQAWSNPDGDPLLTEIQARPYVAATSQARP